MLGAWNITFNEHASAFFQRYPVCGFNLFPRIEFDEYASSMVAVTGFDDNGQADLLSGLPGVFGVGDYTAFRDRNSARAKQRLCQVLVAGNGFSYCGRAVSFGCPNALTATAIAKLHQIAFGQQADCGDIPIGGSFDNTRSG